MAGIAGWLICMRVKSRRCSTGKRLPAVVVRSRSSVCMCYWSWISEKLGGPCAKQKIELEVGQSGNSWGPKVDSLLQVIL